MDNRVLIIEDDEDILFLMELILLDLNINIIKSQGALQISEIENLNPDIILLDYVLNGMLSNNICLELKNNPSTKKIPVILVSAHINLKQIAKQNGADAYLEKPFNIDDLTKLIQQFLTKN